MTKLCSRCSRPAEFSVVSVLSTVGISGRLQKCSAAVLFCADCLQQLLTREHWATDTLREAVNSAYTALNQQLANRVKRNSDDQNAAVVT